MTPFYCGPAAISSVLSGLGIGDYSLTYLATLMNTNSQIGTNPQDMVSAVNGLGGHAVSQQNMTLSEVQQDISIGHPVILLVKSGSESHWIVADGYNAQFFKLMDPWYKHSVDNTYKQLESRWVGTTDQTYVHLGIDVWNNNTAVRLARQLGRSPLSMAHNAIHKGNAGAKSLASGWGAWSSVTPHFVITGARSSPSHNVSGKENSGVGSPSHHGKV